ncbi:recombinase family protein [Lysobacter antibioticus]|uniref:recombinase family protein n=1 Tax=Lysobacter antibioticus TaxID=84531 RepID=UPI0004D02276|nr:recombinase family protein [Lysobacter antibioticus]
MSDPLKRLRCAVYTRVSTEEGLGQAYTSIDAQRDSGEAYIASRRSEGWIPVGDYYDDGGYSGGNLERPALRRLLDDIRAGKIDIVVTYKIDRLTRSLFDFAELFKTLEEHNVTFVAVTQHFNTTDAMGRMVLNIMLTFAQFERELTAERIRDKFIASKRKGLWMHGVPPLGYDVKERRLSINAEEAAVVRWVFQRFAEDRSLQKVAERARLANYRNKDWTSAEGRYTPGKALDKGAIHKILHNRTYLGHLKHRDTEFENTHPPIIDPALWEQTREILSVNAHTRANHSRANVIFLLKGLLFDQDGAAMSPWHTTKRSGQLYRYYLSKELLNRGKLAQSPLPRLPADELESIVVKQFRRIIQSPEMIQATLAAGRSHDTALDEAQVTVAMRNVDRIWDSLFPSEQQVIAQQLIEKITVAPERLEIRFHPLGIQLLADDLQRKAA